MDKILNNIFNEDCLLTLDCLDDNFLDLTVTSPPYNVDLGNNKHNKDRKYDNYNDNQEHKIYLEWLENVFSKIYNKTKNGGRCVINNRKYIGSEISEEYCKIVYSRIDQYKNKI